ncbi:hypothetical protein [Nocardia acidivorans]|uniref:hypothetical protein n=1 Tax=Nocardia acidivorans TaxID=404580 RepID=UPI000A620E2E|nr:hypothetical protein [Nocardia acidivorans]
MTDSDTITGLLVTAVENTWAAIRSHHPDVPDVVLTVGAGSTGGSDLTLGHFAPNRWVRGEYELHELFVGGEGLQRGAVDVLGTLLHEAAHGNAEMREIKDTSRQGRWHNERYRELAEEVRLTVAHHDKIGWSVTTVPGSTRDRYGDELEELAFALDAANRNDAVDGSPTTTGCLSNVTVDGRSGSRRASTTLDRSTAVCVMGASRQPTCSSGLPGWRK